MSWIRRRDWHIMSVGETVYTSDDRVVVTHKKHAAAWTLQFKFAKQRDEGVYECQVDGDTGHWNTFLPHCLAVKSGDDDKVIYSLPAAPM